MTALTDGVATILWAVIAMGVVSLAIVIGVSAFIVRTMLDRGVTRFRDLFTPKPPAKIKVLSILGNSSNQHQTAFVSRHHLAAGGLMCPICQTAIAPGDFSGVEEYLVDGRINEGIVCRGEREVGDRLVPCDMILLASPDTEHGDHLDAEGKVAPNAPDPPEYYRFVRCDAMQALREKWGVDVRDGDDRSNVVEVANNYVYPPAPPETSPKDRERASTAATDVLPAVKGTP